MSLMVRACTVPRNEAFLPPTGSPPHPRRGCWHPLSRASSGTVPVTTVPSPEDGGDLELSADGGQPVAHVRQPGSLDDLAVEAAAVVADLEVQRVVLRERDLDQASRRRRASTRSGSPRGSRSRRRSPPRLDICRPRPVRAARRSAAAGDTLRSASARPAVGQERGVDAVGQLPDLVERLADVLAQRVQLRAARARDRAPELSSRSSSWMRSATSRCCAPSCRSRSRRRRSWSADRQDPRARLAHLAQRRLDPSPSGGGSPARPARRSRPPRRGRAGCRARLS